MADMEKDLGKFIGEQNPFTQEMRLPPAWQTDETIVSFPSVADFWAKLMQAPNAAVSKVIRIQYTVEGQPAQNTYSLYLAYASGEEYPAQRKRQACTGAEGGRPSRSGSLRTGVNTMLTRVARGEAMEASGGVCCPHPFQELIAVRPDLTGEHLACAGILRHARLVRAEAVACRPCGWYLWLYPGGSHMAQLVQCPMHGLEDTFPTVPRAGRRQDMGGIGSLRAPCLEPPRRFAGGQEGVEAPLAGRMGEHAAAKIMQQGEVTPWVGELKAQRLFPLHAAADGIGCLAVGEPFDTRHHHDQG